MHNYSDEGRNDKYVPNIQMATSSMPSREYIKGDLKHQIEADPSSLYECAEQSCYIAGRILSALESIEYKLFGVGDPVGLNEARKCPDNLDSWSRDTYSVLLQIEALANKITNGIR